MMGRLHRFAAVVNQCVLVSVATSFATSAGAAVVLGSAVLPTSRAVEIGQTATSFATIQNVGDETGSGCSIAPATSLSADFFFQTTDPATNALTGTRNQPVDIPAGSFQTFVVGFTPTTEIAPTDVQLDFQCENGGAAAVLSGINTFLLSGSANPGPDVIALAATAMNDGFVVLANDTGTGAFAVATSNVGAGGDISVTADTGDNALLPVTISVCQTDPATGACINPTAPTTDPVSTNAAGGATLTFAVFVSELANVAENAATNRVFVRFEDTTGATRGSTSVAVKSEAVSALSVYSDSVESQVIQATCLGCHVTGGVAAGSALVYQPASETGATQANFTTLSDYLDADPANADNLRNRPLGVAHGGGAVLTQESSAYASLLEFIALVTGTGGAGPTLALWDGVTMAGNESLLRRAALILAGRAPSAAEIDRVAGAGDATLRTAIRDLMTGPGFHDFLLEGANDRLLTDRFLDFDAIDEPEKYPDLTNKLADDEDLPEDDPLRYQFQNQFRFGVARAPLELIAHVVENDLPYTEILTADYFLMTPATNLGLRGSATFDVSAGAGDFEPGVMTGYFRDDDSKIFDEPPPNQRRRILDEGDLATDYPHAGLLNTQAFLRRYPSTATNRNRARARWTYLHFLDLDVEKSATRTTDPDALADRNNPTLNNPACIVCHQVMDPVAGAFQNYGDSGSYRDQWLGQDSLPWLYKCPPVPDGVPDPDFDGCYRKTYQDGDTWYRDMRDPGYDGQIAPDPDNSLQWLAGRIVEDPRFATATIRFWWPAVMGAPPLLPPEAQTDVDFVAKLAAFDDQNRFIDALAGKFRRDTTGNGAFNLKDLLVELFLSRWFRAEQADALDATLDRALQDAGSERLLTPEQLARKTLALTGVSWGRHPGDPNQPRLRNHNFANEYNLLYGGIDSNGVITRSTDVTSVMAAVGQTHALEDGVPDRHCTSSCSTHRSVSCLATSTRSTHRSLSFRVPRRLRVTGGPSAPSTVISGDATAGRATIGFEFENDYCEPCTEEGPNEDRNLVLDRLTIRDATGTTVQVIELEDPGQCRLRGARTLSRCRGRARTY